MLSCSGSLSPARSVCFPLETGVISTIRDEALQSKLLLLSSFPKPVLFGSFPCDPLSPHSVSTDSCRQV